MGWDSPGLGVKVNVLQDYSVIGVGYEPFCLWPGSELGSPLRDLIYSETWPPIFLQFIVGIPPDSNLRYPDLVDSSSWTTFVVPPSGSCPKFLTLSSWSCLTSPSRSNFATTFSGVWPTLPWQHCHSWHCREAKGDNKVEIKLESLVELGFLKCPPSHHSMWLDFQMVC